MMEADILEEKQEKSITADTAVSDQGTENEEKNDVGEADKKHSPKGFIKEIIIYLLVIMICVTLVPRYVIQRTEVDGESMENTLHNYDNLLVEKLTYYFKDPARFDIVTLYPNGKKKKADGSAPEYYIKRIIGLPGENVRIDGNKIYIDGKLLEEHYAKEKVLDEAGIAEGEGITLGDDEFFVMGDNRNNSVDSRFEVGPVKKENIDGHAVFRIFSFENKKNGKRGSISFKKFGTLD